MVPPRARKYSQALSFVVQLSAIVSALAAVASVIIILMR